MKRNERNQHHQHYRNPVNRMADDFKVDDFHPGPLSRRRCGPLLLYNAGNYADNREANSNHQNNSDPIGGGPGDD